MNRLLIMGAALAATLLWPLCAFAQDRGRGERPLVFVFQKQKDPVNIREKADEVAAFLTERMGRKVEAFVPTSYAASVQALVSKRADFAYVSAIPFLLARRDGEASLLLAEVREDAQGVARTTYDSVFVVRDDSELASVGDLVSRAGGLRMAFTSTTSTSGYVMAYSRLVREGLLQPRQNPQEVFRSVNFAGSYTQALEQVLAGRADVCAVSYYTVEGPTAGAYMPEADRARLRVIGRTSSVPTHLVCARGGIDEGVKRRMTQALLELAKERPDLLASVYGATALTEVDEDAHVAPAVEALDFLGVAIETFAN